MSFLNFVETENTVAYCKCAEKVFSRCSGFPDVPGGLRGSVVPLKRTLRASERVEKGFRVSPSPENMNARLTLGLLVPCTAVAQFLDSFYGGGMGLYGSG